MLRVIVVLTLVLFPACAHAQRIHDARAAIVRPAVSLAQPAGGSVLGDTARKNNVGYWVLGGALAGAAIAALLAHREARDSDCESYCMPRIIWAPFSATMGGLVGGLVGALIGSIATSGG